MIRPTLVIGQIQRSLDSTRVSIWGRANHPDLSGNETVTSSKPVVYRVVREKTNILAAISVLAMFGLLYMIFSANDTASLGHIIDTEQWASSSTAASDFQMFNVLGDFDPKPIQNMCNHKRFQEGLYLSCEDNDGGIGNLRNSILLCTRYAVESGAHLIAPRIHLRSVENIADLGGERTNMSYLFDYEVYKDRLQNACPGFKVYDSIEDVETSVPLLRTEEDLNPVDFHGHEMYANLRLLEHRVDLRAWIWSQLQVRPSKETPVLINLQRAYFGWLNTQDPYDVWREWSKLLQFQPNIYHISARILTLLSNEAMSTSLEPSIGRDDDFKFVGQHLRTEQDASIEMQMYGFDPQMTIAISACKLDDIAHLYIASGDAGEAAKATLVGAESAIAVHTKYSLMLADADLTQAIIQLTFDQQALIDYLILSKSTSFVGVDSSSFSGNLAVLRHATMNDKTHWTGFSDGLSFLLGDRYEWLRDSMWP